MKLGFLTSYSENIVRFAGTDDSFECLEIFGPPDEWIGDTAKSKANRSQAKALLAENELTVASFLSTKLPQLHDSGRRLSTKLDYLDRLMTVCNDMDVRILTGPGPMGYDPRHSLPENIALYRKVYSQVTRVCEANGVKIAFENWPGDSPFADGGNLSITPEAWTLMFNAVPSEYIGLEFDPSHLIWQHIDPIAAFDEFSHRVYVLHAKDTEIHEDRLRHTGVFGRCWWRYRLPGFADLDWSRLFSMAHEHGYNDAVIIEHEDAVFAGERRLEGLHRCGRFLSRCIMD